MCFVCIFLYSLPSTGSDTNEDSSTTYNDHVFQFLQMKYSDNVSISKSFKEAIDDAYGLDHLRSLNLTTAVNVLNQEQQYVDITSENYAAPSKPLMS